MSQRGIAMDLIDLVLEFGRMSCTRGAVIHAVGRKEVEHYRKKDVDLSSCDSIQVVCSMDGAVITAYRNADFRGLRADRLHKRRRARRVPFQRYCRPCEAGGADDASLSPQLRQIAPVHSGTWS